MRVATSETGAAWNDFFADLVARGLTGVRLVTSYAHAGLREAIAANLPGASWQRSRTHNAFNLMGLTPKTMWPAVKAMLHSVYDQPDAAALQAQIDRLLDYVGAKLPEVHDHLDRARAGLLSFTVFSQGDLDPDPVPQPHRTPQQEIRRRTDSVGIFPNRNAIVRSSARSWPSRPTNGPKAAATSGSTSSPAPASPSSPPPPDLTRAPPAAARVSVG